MLLYLLRYMEGILKLFIFVIVFGLLTLIVTGTELEKLLVWMLSVTPGVGLGKAGNFSINQASIITFFAVWGIFFSLISEVANKLIKIRIDIKGKASLFITLVLVVVSLVVLTYRFGFSNAILLVGGLFLLFVLSYFFVRIINHFKEILIAFKK